MRRTRLCRKRGAIGRRLREEADERVKDALAATIVGIATPAIFDDILELVRDRMNGPSRIILLHILERSKDPRAHPALLELADDPDLKIQIKDSLKQIKRRKMRQAQKAAQKNPTRH